MTGTPADTYGPFDGTDYFAADWRDTAGFRYLTHPGVIFGVDNDLLPYADSSGMHVKVKAGFFYIEGHGARWLNETVLPIAAYSTNRWDRIVVRLDFTASTTNGKPFVVLDILTGTTTAKPALTQNTSIWEEALGWVVVDNNVTVAADHVNDERFGAAGRGGVISCMDYYRPTQQLGRQCFERNTGRVRRSTGTVWRWQVGSGKILGTNLSKTGSQSIPAAAWQGLTFDSENWDNDSFHSGTGYYVTIPEDGIYRMRLKVDWAAVAASDRYVAAHLDTAAWTSGAPSHILNSSRAPTSTAVAGRTLGIYEFNTVAGAVISFLVRQEQDSGSAALNVAGASADIELIGYAT